MKKLIEWMIKRFCPGYHLHRDPARKEATTERGGDEI